jgi:hypothetical protein
MFNQTKEYLSNLLEKEYVSILSIVISVVIGLLLLIIFQNNTDLLRLLYALLYLLQHLHH